MNIDEASHLLVEAATQLDGLQVMAEHDRGHWTLSWGDDFPIHVLARESPLTLSLRAPCFSIEPGREDHGLRRVLLIFNALGTEYAGIHAAEVPDEDGSQFVLDCSLSLPDLDAGRFTAACVQLRELSQELAQFVAWAQTRPDPVLDLAIRDLRA